MKTITITEGIRLTATAATIATYEDECREIAEWKRDCELLARAAEVGDWDFYSDLHKDMYGFRPRW